MLTLHFHDLRSRKGARPGPFGPYLGGYVERMEAEGLAAKTVRNHVGAVSHLNRWAGERNLGPESLDSTAIEALREHACACCCFSHEPATSLRLVPRVRDFLDYLRKTGVGVPLPEEPTCEEPEVLAGFRRWMVEQRGVTPGTLRTYGWPLRQLVATLGSRPVGHPDQVRTFLQQYCLDRGAKSVENARIAVRMFLRFQAAEGLCADGWEEQVLGLRVRRPRATENLRGGLLGPFLEGFRDQLERNGLAPSTRALYLAGAVRFNRWASERGLPLEQLDEAAFQGFHEHLTAARRSTRANAPFLHVLRPVRCFVEYLRRQGLPVPAMTAAVPPPPLPALLQEFGQWMIQHRGLAASTVDRYQDLLREVTDVLGEDPSHYSARTLRSFVLEFPRRGKRPRGASHAVTALRVFLRYLAAVGRCAPGLAEAVPTVADWQLSSLPRYLESEQVERLVSGCDASTPEGLRDRAVLLLLARLGLRSGDVRGLRLSDVDWDEATLRLVGKGRREDRLPLTQEVGDALAAYVERARPKAHFDHVFLSTKPPVRPWASSSTVSAIVAKHLRRAGVVAPLRGAHLLRHSAATSLLRQGASLDQIGALLRHRRRDTTAIYAKVDIALLKLVAQPWPGVRSC